jgi:hypothetical protein
MKHFQNIIEVVLEHNTLIGKLHSENMKKNEEKNSKKPRNIDNNSIYTALCLSVI